MRRTRSSVLTCVSNQWQALCCYTDAYRYTQHRVQEAMDLATALQTQMEEIFKLQNFEIPWFKKAMQYLQWKFLG